MFLIGLTMNIFRKCYMYIQKYLFISNIQNIYEVIINRVTHFLIILLYVEL